MCRRFLLLVFVGSCVAAGGISAQDYKPHPWLPPYGLDRVGVTLPNADPDKLPAFEADAVARLVEPINPVDLGCILVPSDWLLLGPNQKPEVEIAALARSDNFRGVVSVCYSSHSQDVTTQPLFFRRGEVMRATISLPDLKLERAHDVLQISIANLANGKQVWKKEIPVMVVARPPSWPKFGAVRYRLRYDAPISVREADGSFSQLEYAKAWDESLDDVVVCLPNGARFVFWRGSSYIPFWAGRHNTGLSYEWAETSPPADGFVDCVEPLMDKELRYSRVEIIESTASRVHVRWTYQSCDFQYKVWGDAATEDFYFYPDGFGTRVLTIQSDLDSDYELSEFIILTPQSTYPFSVLPKNLITLLFLDGEKRELEFPFRDDQKWKLESRESTIVYRVRLHQDDPMTAIYFHPQEVKPPPVVFAAFEDQGHTVTPCYWGSHWPLARGQTTGGAINDRVHFSPCHNSVMSWARQRPPALREATFAAIDTLGRAKPMRSQTWAWLIGISDASDQQLSDRARSFASPASMKVRGGRLAAESYVPECRMIQVIVEKPTIEIELSPSPVCVNPVFQLTGPAANKNVQQVRLNDQPLAKQAWTWDGQTLWIDARLQERSSLAIEFGERP